MRIEHCRTVPSGRYRRGSVLQLVEGVLEAGKRQLANDMARAATSSEVTVLRREARALKEVVAEQALELRLLKKSMIADGETGHEIPGLREAGDHPPGRAIAPAGPSDPCQARYPARDVLTSVRPVPEWRARSAGRSGIPSPTMFASRSSNWLLTSPSCRRGNWRHAALILGSRP